MGPNLQKKNTFSLLLPIELRKKVSSREFRYQNEDQVQLKEFRSNEFL